ncbi:hypothetical protein UlMin_032367 [Ulmus minor]
MSLVIQSSSNWRKVKVLGSGSCATVFLAISTSSAGLSNLIAVKSALLTSSYSLQKENKIFKQFKDCPEIVRYYGAALSIERGIHVYNLFFEFASGGTLSNLIKYSRRSIPETYVRKYTKMILKGLCSIHARGFVHCDLKPDNILVFPSNQIGILPQLKIADFGLAQYYAVDPNQSPRITYPHGFPGTPVYMPPESLFSEIKPPLDIWSLGCIVIEMITGKLPWQTSPDMNTLKFMLLYTDTIPQIPDSMSATGKDFLTKCLARNASKRWSAFELLDHPFITHDETQTSGPSTKYKSIIDDSSQDLEDKAAPGYTNGRANRFIIQESYKVLERKKLAI